MQIELIGCTSSGKSTLAAALLQAGRQRGIDVCLGDDFVLRLVRLNWVRGKVARAILMDVISLGACLTLWRRHYRYYRFLLGVLWRLPASVAWGQRVNLLRNALKNLARYVIIRSRATKGQVVLTDEGTLHTAHYLFVHVSAEPHLSDLSAFVKLVPLPDVAVYVRQSQSVLIDRTLQRGHKRIPGASHANVERFVRRAVAVFDWLGQEPALQPRLVVVEGGSPGAGGEAVTTVFDYLAARKRTAVAARARAAANEGGRDTDISSLWGVERNVPGYRQARRTHRGGS